jgi:FHA domain
LNDLEPITVLLKFGFIAVLYLFLLWVTRSASRDLLRGVAPSPETGIRLGAEPSGSETPDAWLVVEKGAGLRTGDRIDLFGDLTIGRSGQVDVPIEDPYASQVHARVYSHAGQHYVEDLGSTNGTFLNDSGVTGPRALNPDDRLRIGDTEFRYEV